MKLKVPEKPELNLCLEQDDLYPFFALMATKKVSTCIEASTTIFNKDVFKAFSPKSDINFNKAYLVFGITREYDPDNPYHDTIDCIYLKWFHESDVSENNSTESHFIDLTDISDEDFCYWHDFTRDAKYDYKSFTRFCGMIDYRLSVFRTEIEKYSQEAFGVRLNISYNENATKEEEEGDEGD